MASGDVRIRQSPVRQFCLMCSLDHIFRCICLKQLETVGKGLFIENDMYSHKRMQMSVGLLICCKTGK